MQTYKEIQTYVYELKDLDSDTTITYLLKAIRCRDKRIDELEEIVATLKLDIDWRSFQ